MRLKLTFKIGPKLVAEVKGVREIDTGELAVADITTRIIETEQYLERLLGLRVHIEQLHSRKEVQTNEVSY